MAIQTQLQELFEHSGMNAEDSQGNLQPNEYHLLENVELSDNKTLKKRKGFCQRGDKQSTSEIKYLDRYIDGSTKFLLKSEAQKLYYEDLTTGITSPIRIRATLASGANYDSTDRTLELTTTAAHPFVVGDDISVTIAGTAYYWSCEEILSVTEIKVLGVLADVSASIVGTEVLYGSRTTDEIRINSSVGFAVNDMVVIDGHNRPFKVTGIAGNVLTIDDDIYIQDVVGNNDVLVYSRWEQFTTADGNIQNDTPFDSNAGVDQISSSMLDRSIIMANGEDEPLVFDGTLINRLGFHELPDMVAKDDNAAGDPAEWYNLWAEAAGSLDIGTYNYKITYAYYDSNNTRHESGTSSVRSIVLGAASNVLIPIFSIPYAVNDNLMYDVNKCVVTAWRTEVDGDVTYYRAVEVPMKQLGSFMISEVEGQPLDIMRLTLDGSPDLSNVIVGDYLVVKGLKTAADNGVYEITTVDNVNSYIEVDRGAACTDDDAGTSLRGYCVICIRDNVNDYELISNSLLYTNEGVESVNDSPPISKYITTWDNKVFAANGKSYQEMFINLDLTVGAGSPFTDGDEIIITDGTTTEIYEVEAAGAADVTNGSIRLDCQNVDDLYTQVKVLCETINANPEGLVWAYYENVLDAGGIILRERQRSDQLQLKFILTTASLLTSVKVNNTWLDATDNSTFLNFRQDLYTSRIWWTKNGTPGSFVGTFLSDVTDDVQYKDVAKNDGQQITGIMPLSTMLLVFKENSIYRMVKASSGYEFELVDAEIGTKSPKSIVVIGNKALFLNPKGVYATDGFSTKFVGKKVNNYWKDLPQEYVHLACGSHNIDRHQYWVCYVDTSTTATQSTNNRVMVYDYINDSWFTNVNIEATMFTKIDNDLYYSGYNGLVYRARNYGHTSDYRDDASAISASIITPWLTLGSKTARKMFTRLTIHGYLSDTSNREMEVEYSVDMSEKYYELQPISILSSPWGHFPWGASPWGLQVLQPLRQSVSPQKCTYARFKFSNNVIDEAIELLGYSVEGKLLSVEGVKQP